MPNKGSWVKPFVAGVLFALPVAAGATTFEVGPGKTYANVGDAPLESLVAGDTVLVYYRATPYREKFVIGGSGTQAAPIRVSGVLGPNGERPILDGSGATTRAQLNYPSRGRGIIKIGYSNVPYAVDPKWIVIENLCSYADRLGPYSSEDEASRALEKVKERNEEWDNDPRWNDKG